jgi:hypothetical protein
MDDFVKLSPEERRIFFEGTAAPRNMQAQIVEKDFWVCWTLKELFRLPTIGEHLIFKGGTSLSKVFKIIERFSEDIDVSIDRGFLGFGGTNEPEAGGSNKEKQRRIEALKAACQQKIAVELLPALEAAIRSKVRHEDQWLLRLDDDDPDKQTLLFAYPTSFVPDAAGYIRRVVKIEMGARADHWPCETNTVTPYVVEQFPQGFREADYVVKVLSVERTFWEKATILHAEFHRPAEKAMPERFSRHYCDFHEVDSQRRVEVRDRKAGFARARGGAQKSFLQIFLGKIRQGDQGFIASCATGTPIRCTAAGLREDAANVLRRTAGIRRNDCRVKTMGIGIQPEIAAGFGVQAISESGRNYRCVLHDKT